MTALEIHGRLANTALLYSVILALWGLWRFIRGQNMDGNFWGAVVIAELLFICQVSLGLYMAFSGAGKPAGYEHILYGIVSVLVLPGIFFFTRGDDKKRAVLIYAVGFLFLVGIVIRAIMTSG